MNTNSNFFQRNLCRMALLLCLLSLSFALQAQEFLTGLKTNTQIVKNMQQKELIEKQQSKSKSDNPPLLLPFFEDFSNYTGYPDEKFFIDKQAYVNNTFPVFPPSIGVVTLDALNEYGEIYSHLNNTSKGADTLTSRYIRLDSLFLSDTVRAILQKDSLYFSFYFQPGGSGIYLGNAGEHIGNQPNINDSLVLEFGYVPAWEDSVYTVWDHIWSTPGFNNDMRPPEDALRYFKQVMIPITDQKYLCDKFQFRFRNYASLEPQGAIAGWEGNVDQWHIDYIRLDVNRNYKDVSTNDLAFVSPTTSFLENYQSMPWKQFQHADTAVMKSRFTNQLANLSDGERTSLYKYYIINGDNLVYIDSTPAIDVKPYLPDNGIVKDTRLASPAIRLTPKDLTSGLVKDTATFKITHVFSNSSGLDFCTANDTCVFEQKFLDYYAYDDGTAEYGYCLNNEYGIAYLAIKFQLQVRDSLSAVRIWFNHTKNSENEEANFSIIVWSDKDGEPDSVRYTLEGLKPDFAEQFLDFVEYQFDKKVSLPAGDFWVGFEQQGNVQLNIGFDQNADTFIRNYFRYNTHGKWETSAYKGVPMLRPVFGNDIKPNPPKEKPKSSIVVGPNPASDKITIINYELPITKVEIYDIMGRKQKTESGKQNEIDISALPAGIYFVRIQTEQETVIKKIVKY